jgi:hypothetical protein
VRFPAIPAGLKFLLVSLVLLAVEFAVLAANPLDMVVVQLVLGLLVATVGLPGAEDEGPEAEYPIIGVRSLPELAVRLREFPFRRFIRTPISLRGAIPLTVFAQILALEGIGARVLTQMNFHLERPVTSRPSPNPESTPKIHAIQVRHDSAIVNGIFCHYVRFVIFRRNAVIALRKFSFGIGANPVSIRGTMASRSQQFLTRRSKSGSAPSVDALSRYTHVFGVNPSCGTVVWPSRIRLTQFGRIVPNVILLIETRLRKGYPISEETVRVLLRNYYLAVWHSRRGDASECLEAGKFSPFIRLFLTVLTTDVETNFADLVASISKQLTLPSLLNFLRDATFFQHFVLSPSENPIQSKLAAEALCASFSLSDLSLDNWPQFSLWFAG